MLEELLDKSYIYYDGSNRKAARMTESERIEILNALSTYYKMSSFSKKDLEELEKIFIVLFNYSEEKLVESNCFLSAEADKLFKEIQFEFQKQ